MQLKKNNIIKPIAWLVLPLAMMAMFLVYPAISAILNSFLEWSRGSSRFIWLDNYKSIFGDEIFLRSFKNMIILTVFGLICGNVATLFLAELLFNMKRQGLSKVFRYLFLIPSLVPGMVTILLWKNIVLSGTPEGLLNSILNVFGVQPQAWYFSEKLSKFSIIFTGFPWVGGISFLIYLAGLQSIPESCYEAAKLDGVTTIQRIIYIDLKLLVNQIKYFIIIGLIGSVQSFDLQLIITDGGPNYSTIVPGYILYLKTNGYSDIGEASAIGVVLFLITLAGMLAANRLSSGENS